jgi:hypothetical protein
VSNPDQNPDAYGFTTEIGHADNVRVAWSRVTNRAILAASDPDSNPELEFPESVPVFRQMVTTDGQVGAVMRAIRNAILKAAWTLEDDGVRPEVSAFVRENLGLPMPGEALPRRRLSTVVWRQHLSRALSELTYGFSVFEQTYVTGPAPAGAPGGSSFRVNLHKLSERGQASITQIEVDEGGGLVAVYQRIDPSVTALGAIGQTGLGVDARHGYELEMPVNRVVVYVNEQEGGNWYGTSMLRSAYKYWRVNDVVLRLAAQIIERNGMGIPGMEYDGTVVTKAEAEKAVAEWRTGATAGLVYPKGATPVLKGVEGQTPDPLPLLAYNDQSISRSVLAMFLNLGHDNGARALGETFVDAFTDSLQAVADAVGATATEHIVRDLVELNWGPDEAYPTVTPGSLASQALISAADLKQLVDGGLIKPGAPTREWVRFSYGLPPDDADNAPEPAPVVVANPFGQQPPVQPAPTAGGPPQAPAPVPALVPRQESATREAGVRTPPALAQAASAALDELDVRVQGYIRAIAAAAH